MRALVLANEPTLALSVVRSLGSCGFSVDVMGSARWSVYGLSRHCQHVIEVAPTAFKTGREMAARIEAYCREADVDVIVPSDVETTTFVARWRETWGRGRTFPVPDVDLIDECDDKWRFANRMQRLGVPHPETTRIDDLAAIAPLRKLAWKEPRFIKPARGSFSMGAVRLDTPDDLDRYARGEGRRHAAPFLLQEFVPGDDIDMSVLAVDGQIVASTIQRMGGDELAKVFVSDPRVDTLGRRIVEALGYHGVVHFDMRIDARTGSAVVLEANPRFWATLSHSVWAGVNFAELGVRIALGESIEAAALAHVEGPCRKPTLWPSSVVRELLGGALRSASTRAAWKAIFTDPVPQIAWKLTKSGSLSSNPGS